MAAKPFINAVFLYNDKMLITFNYKEGTKTITFDDVKKEAPDGASGSDLDCCGTPLRTDLWMSGSRAERARLTSKGLSSFKTVTTSLGHGFVFLICPTDKSDFL